MAAKLKQSFALWPLFELSLVKNIQGNWENICTNNSPFIPILGQWLFMLSKDGWNECGIIF